jgi:FkbM family methyltransferase
MKAIGLCMIVKNESKVILRCLESVRQIVDYVLIEDTGSTDGTQAIIRQWLDRVGVPGEVYDEPWRDFAYNRSHALTRLREKRDVYYALIMDADDVLELPRGFKMPHLKADSYTLEIWQQELRYWRTQLIRNALPWRYEGVLHEFLSRPVGPDNRRSFPEDRRQNRLPGVRIRMSEEGARRTISASERYRRDAALLESALASETDPFLISRYIFYLAQSYRDCGEPQKALANYLKRAELGFWDQEVFISLCQAASLMADLGFDEENVLSAYLRAHNIRKDRAEALHGAARFCRAKGRFEEGYKFAQRALRMNAPPDGLFLEPWVYDYGVLDEYAVTAYRIGKFDECQEACKRLLRERKLPADVRERVENNARFARENLSKKEDGQMAQTATEIDQIFASLYDAAERLRADGGLFDEVIAAYDRASSAAPYRAEALHDASRLCRLNNKFAEGYEYARRGLAILPPGGGLFVQQWIYDYGLLDEFAVNAYWIARYQECFDACQRLLRESKIPEHMHDRVKMNAEFAAEQIRLKGDPCGARSAAPAQSNAIQRDFLFDLLRPDRLTAIVDVGANPIDSSPPYKTLLDHGRCRVIGFEPQPAALRSLNARKSELEIYLPHVVGDGKPGVLKVCRASGMTSLFTPNPRVLQNFPGFPDWGQVVEEVPVGTLRLDDIAEIEWLDFLKMDVQGAELSVLRNGHERLKSTVAVQTEVSFVPLYKNQPTFGDIDLELRRLGFIPHCFVEIKKKLIAPLEGKTPHEGINQLLEADILYTRDFTNPEQMTPEQLKHLAILAHHCYSSFDLAANCIHHLAGTNGVPTNALQQYVAALEGAGMR